MGLLALLSHRAGFVRSLEFHDQPQGNLPHGRQLRDRHAESFGILLHLYAAVGLGRRRAGRDRLERISRSDPLDGAEYGDRVFVYALCRLPQQGGQRDRRAERQSRFRRRNSKRAPQSRRGRFPCRRAAYPGERRRSKRLSPNRIFTRSQRGGNPPRFPFRYDARVQINGILRFQKIKEKTKKI